VALGYAVAKAPSFRERRRLALGLHGLVTDQEEFFVKAFEQLGGEAISAPGAPCNALAAPRPLHSLSSAGVAKRELLHSMFSGFMAAAGTPIEGYCIPDLW